MDNLACTGTETDLADCGHNGFAQHNCGHHEDVSISCDVPHATRTLHLTYSSVTAAVACCNGYCNADTIIVSVYVMNSVTGICNKSISPSNCRLLSVLCKYEETL